MTKTKVRRQKYPLIVLWGRKLGSDPEYIEAEILRATERNAPRRTPLPKTGRPICVGANRFKCSSGTMETVTSFLNKTWMKSRL